MVQGVDSAERPAQESQDPQGVPLVSTLPPAALALPTDHPSNVLFVTVIDEEEGAVRRLLGSEKVGDSSSYVVNHCHMRGHQGNVHMAAELAAYVVRVDKPFDLAFLLGTAGTLKPRKAALNSVVVANEVAYYERAKWISRAEQSGTASQSERHYRPALASIDSGLDHLLGFIHSQMPVLVDPRASELTTNPIDWRIGQIASGECVWASAGEHLTEEVTRIYDEALAAETEGFGFMKACAAMHIPYGMVVRGISDALVDKEAVNALGSRETASEHAVRLAIYLLDRLHEISPLSVEVVHTSLTMQHNLYANQEVTTSREYFSQPRANETILVATGRDERMNEVIKLRKSSDATEQLAALVLRLLTAQGSAVDRLTLNQLISRQLGRRIDQAMLVELDTSIDLLMNRGRIRMIGQNVSPLYEITR
jgi:nucleoside phosphorylase